MSNYELQIRDISSADEQMKQMPFTNECFMRSSLNALFSDIENFVPPFHGANSENFKVWLENFKDTVNLFNLNALKKIVYAKRSVQGKAKLFLESELNAKTPMPNLNK